MNWKISGRAAIMLATVVAVGCGKGKTGAQGPVGDPGPTGPIGPPTVAPQVSSVWPPMVNESTRLRIRGTGFSPTAADDLVTVNGYPVTVASATGTELWVTGLPGADVFTIYGGPTANPAADVSVSVAGQMSNPSRIELMPSGTFVTNFNQPRIGNPSAVVLDATETALYFGDLYSYDSGFNGQYGAIYKYDLSTKEVTLAFMNQGYDYISALAYGPDGKLYMGAQDMNTGDSNLYRFDNGFDPDSITRLTSSAVDCNIENITWMANGDLWLADDCGEVDAIRKSDGQFFFDVMGFNELAGLHGTVNGLVIVDIDGNVYRSDAALPSPSTNSVGSYGNGETVSSVTDGTNVFLFNLGSDDGAIIRVTPDGAFAPITPRSAWLDNYFSNGFPAGGSLVRTQAGEFYTMNYYDGILARLSKNSVENLAMFPYYYNPESVVSIDGDMYMNFSAGCEYGIGAPVMRLSADLPLKVIDRDVCGYSNLVAVNDKIYAVDQRGFILEIDPASGTDAVVSADPNIPAAPISFATDGTNFFIAYQNTAGNFNVAKFGIGDTPVSEPHFLANLTSNPNEMAVIGTDLFWSHFDGLSKVPVAGGSETLILGSAIGPITHVGLGAPGELLFTAVQSGFSTVYRLTAAGQISPVLTLDIFAGAPGDGMSSYTEDKFGTITTLKYGEPAQVLQ